MRDDGRFRLTIHRLTDKLDALILGRWRWEVYDEEPQVDAPEFVAPTPSPLPRLVGEGWARTPARAHRKATREIRRYLEREAWRHRPIVTHIEPEDFA